MRASISLRAEQQIEVIFCEETVARKRAESFILFLLRFSFFMDPFVV